MGIFSGDFPVFKKWAGRKTGIDKPWWILGSWCESTFPRFISEVQVGAELYWWSSSNVYYWHIFTRFYSFGVWGKPRITPHNKAFHKNRGGRQAKVGMPASFATLSGIWVCLTGSDGDKVLLDLLLGGKRAWFPFAPTKQFRRVWVGLWGLC